MELELLQFQLVLFSSTEVLGIEPRKPSSTGFNYQMANMFPYLAVVEYLETAAII
jgi:hypothetical protein